MKFKKNNIAAWWIGSVFDSSVKARGRLWLVFGPRRRLTRSLGAPGTISLEDTTLELLQHIIYYETISYLCCSSLFTVHGLIVCVLLYQFVWCPQPRTPQPSSPAAAASHRWLGSAGRPAACRASVGSHVSCVVMAMSVIALTNLNFNVRVSGVEKGEAVAISWNCFILSKYWTVLTHLSGTKSSQSFTSESGTFFT